MTCTEIIVRLRQPPTMYEGFELKANHCRLRISPNVAFAIGMNSIDADDETLNQPLEISWGHCPHAEEMDGTDQRRQHHRLIRACPTKGVRGPLSCTLSAHFVENGQKPHGSTKFSTKARDKVG